MKTRLKAVKLPRCCGTCSGMFPDMPCPFQYSLERQPWNTCEHWKSERMFRGHIAPKKNKTK